MLSDERIIELMFPELFVKKEPNEWLIHACKYEKIEVAKRHLDNGADPNTKDSDGNSAINIAIEANDTAIFKLLLSYGAKIDEIIDKFGEKFETLLINAVKTKNLEIAKYLLEAGADISIVVSNGWKAIHYARTPAMVDLLMSYGADPEALVLGVKRDFNLICLAFTDLNDDLVRYLVKDLGIDIEKEWFFNTGPHMKRLRNSEYLKKILTND